jgi:hypothetical protein
MQGTLFDLPQVIGGLAPRLNPNVADRIRLMEGNMFESIPPGADAYIMKRITHDWTDERCGKILSGEPYRVRRRPDSLNQATLAWA